MTLPNNKAALRQTLSLQGDRTLWAIFFILTAISLVEVYSAASSLTVKFGIIPTILGHFKYLVIGFLCVWVFHNIPCRWFKLWAPVWVVSIFLLLFLTLFGAKINDGARWIPILGVRFQPSEFAKGALVVVVSIILSTYQTKKGTDHHAFKYIMIVSIITCLLIFFENFSTAMMLFAVVIIMMIFGRVPMKQLSKLFVVLATIVAIAVLAVKTLPMDHITDAIPALHRLDNAVARIDRFTGNKKDLTQESKNEKVRKWGFDLEKEMQVGHSNIAIAKSNIIGCGPGNSKERDFLPQAFSDFIFAIIIEELGLVGGAGIVLLYIILLFRACRIAKKCERNFPAFMVLGLAMLIVVQALVNMGVAVGLFPVTGQTLPLISRGGSSIIVTSIYFGMMISVSRFAKQREPENGTPKPAGNAEAVPDVINQEEYQSTEGMK